MKIYWDSYGIVRGPSGIFVHARELQRSLSNNGVNVTVLDSEVGQGFFRPIIQSKLVAPEVCFRKFSRIHGGGPAVYHGLSNFNLPLWDWRTRRADVKYVLTIHDLIPVLAPRFGVSSSLRMQAAFLIPRAIKMADAIVAVSEWTARTIVERYPEAKGRIAVIPNGFPDLRTKRTSPESVGMRPRILTVGRSENYKRHDLFLEVLEEAGGALCGTLVTPGLPESLMGRAARLNRKGLLDIAVSPTPEALQKIYSCHDVYVQTSLLEGFCLPAAEAQAHGIPVVFTSGSGIDEVVCRDSGKAVSAGATAVRWVSEILAVAAARSETAPSLERWVASRPTWNDSAIALKTLYNSL